jgi:hypothetical protein
MAQIPAFICWSEYPDATAENSVNKWVMCPTITAGDDTPLSFVEFDPVIGSPFLSPLRENAHY